MNLEMPPIVKREETQTEGNAPAKTRDKSESYENV